MKKRKSTTVVVGLSVVTLVSLLGCDSGPRYSTVPSGQKRCVDKNNNVVVDPEKCRDQERSTTHTSGGVYPYFWYMGGYGHGYGQPVGGGYYQPAYPSSRGGYASSPSPSGSKPSVSSHSAPTSIPHASPVSTPLSTPHSSGPITRGGFGASASYHGGSSAS